jgi:hypothetical protein
MGIRIAEINVQNLGPISNLQMKLAGVNLIYGRNESGKTHLVEFLIRSLFKAATYPGMRPLAATGKVMVEGLEPAAVSFSPSSRKKLEEYLKNEERTLPENISRLLVVRAGELSLWEDQSAGADRKILEEYLSNSGLINAIRGKIPPNALKASVAEGVIQGPRQGQVKDHYVRKDELKALDDLLARVNSEYSGGKRAELQAKLEKTRADLDVQRQARCYRAYALDQKIQRQQKLADQIPDRDLQDLRRAVDEHRLKSEALQKMTGNHQARAAACAELPWLKAAVEEYQALTLGEKAPAAPVWTLLVGGFLLLGALVLILLGQPHLAAGLLLAGCAAGYAYIHLLRKGLRQAGKSAEIQRIAAEYQRKFGRDLTDLAALRAVYETQKEAAIAAETFAAQMNAMQTELSGLEQRISDGFFALKGDRPAPDAWDTQAQALERRAQEILSGLEQYKLELARLNVKPQDFRGEPCGHEYDEARFRGLEQQVQQLEQDLRSEDDRLNGLRQRLAQETRSEFTATWERLIEKLQEKRAAGSRQYHEVTAQLLADIAVNSALNDLYQDEERSIQAGLHSVQISGYLRQLTTHYEQISFADSVLKVSDPSAEYAFNQLSTATQEQTLLALRLGFSARCFSDQSLFLVLDDAFQHSDWKRREALIQGVLGITRLGWQVIYLTMDDHIRDLFRSQAKDLGEDQFRYYELQGPALLNSL